MQTVTVTLRPRSPAAEQVSAGENRKNIGNGLPQKIGKNVATPGPDVGS